jgi:hypothetical protein
MNPFRYSLAEVWKPVVALIFLIVAAIGLFITAEPGFVEACVTLAGAVFAVIGVFAAKNHTKDDLQKALEQLKGATLAVVAYFAVVPTSTEEQITALVGAVASVIAVYWTSNAKPAAQPASVEPAAALSSRP